MNYRCYHCKTEWLRAEPADRFNVAGYQKTSQGWSVQCAKCEKWTLESLARIESAPLAQASIDRANAVAADMLKKQPTAKPEPRKREKAMSTLGRQLKEKMKANGWTSTYVHRQTGISAQTIRNWTSGTHHPTKALAKKLSTLLENMPRVQKIRRKRTNGVPTVKAINADFDTILKNGGADLQLLYYFPRENALVQVIR